MGKYLVCYFSPTGTTRAVGEHIATAIKADRLEIKPKEPYTENDLNWRKYFSRCNKEHRRKKLPEVGFHMFNLAQYGIVFLGFPIWYETAPNIILSFLKTNDWAGQKIVLFATSGGSSISKAREDIRAFLNKQGEIPVSGILDLSDPEKVKNWARNALDIITRTNLSAAEEYVRRNYTGYVPAVKEEHSSYDQQAKPTQDDSESQKTHYSRAVTNTSTLNEGNNPPAKKSSEGGKYSRDFEPKYSLDLTPDPEIEKLRRENDKLQMVYQQLLREKRGNLPRSPLDRYNSSAIERVMRSAPTSASRSTLIRSLDSYTDQSFVGKLMALIREKGMKEPEVYRAAQIDRKLFSKITSDQDYKPSKDTCVALAYALKLSLAEANDLLSRAGYTLSHSNKRDVILEYFFSSGKFNLFDINEVLSQLNQRPLGRQS